MSHPFEICERGEWLFFSTFEYLLYPSFYLFRMWLLSMLWCELTISHFSISLSSFIFVLFLHFTLPHLFFSFLLLDVWFGFNVHTLFLLIRCVHSFIITFRVGTPRSETHDVFYALHFMHEGYGDYIIGIFESSFLSFLSPYYLSPCYVLCLKTTLRPLRHIVFDSSHVGNTRAWSEIISRSMMDGELRWWFTLGHTPLISDGFSEVTLSTLGHTPSHRWQFLSGMTLCTEA